MTILQSLGSLILGSVPTMILFILLVAAYSVLVRRPLERVLAERRLRTSGAVEQARGAIAAAEAETAVYEGKLRAARQELLAERERRAKLRQAERDTVLAATRAQAGERIRAARSDIEASALTARQQIEGAVAELGDSIVKTLLPKGAGTGEVRP